MSKAKTLFICQSCGAESPRWVGKCSNCEGWNTFAEEVAVSSKQKPTTAVFADKPVLLKSVVPLSEQRYITGIKEFDSVMGGGIVPGAVTLIGGDPGIGKSTLALQIACRLSQQGHKVLYVSGEESVQQTSLRARRLVDEKNDLLYIVNQIDITAILQYIKTMKPTAVVIDSVQVVYHPDISSAPGSVSQVRECAAAVTQAAKTMGIAAFLIGHVTKEGMIAGPRVLEHIVDTVLYFEGERYSTYRVLRAVKNRFGSTNEIGVFEMTGRGLEEVANPSEIFLSERPQDAVGSVVVPVIEGTRPFLVEVQGLVSRSSYGIARHKAQGFDPNRLAILIAVLEKRMGLSLGDKDVFVNVAGGVKLEDPAADLAVATAIASAGLDKPVSPDTVILGEVGLSSEVRSVSQIAARLKESVKLGFRHCVMPRNNLRSGQEVKIPGLQIIPVENVKEALGIFSQRRTPDRGPTEGQIQR
ncbi:MAG: DNA repair protein RadA, partial [Candidatus Omnitrophica bacterium]|nr:DNA repair protein RadA [Candidatus Omnitrophota bacterium]